MAKCNCCGREMLTANGCSYKRVVIKGKHKKTFNRIKVGDPCHWTGFGEVPDDVSLEPVNFPIDDIYPGGRHDTWRAGAAASLV